MHRAYLLDTAPFPNFSTGDMHGCETYVTYVNRRYLCLKKVTVISVALDVKHHILEGPNHHLM